MKKSRHLSRQVPQLCRHQLLLLLGSSWVV
jgi:hypothetical protein